ncbi:hypothetical protein Syun_017023 [Stephania yunnanensis]|uniref:Glycolipid transfer protein domain-containing protein n=1 Tax=Stephania yunnanensis TaxID=152371 RepID=A0AAP0J665_9MAGN
MTSVLKDCSLREVASTAYAQVRAPFHSWAVRTSAYAGMYVLPTREELLQKLNEIEASSIHQKTRKEIYLRESDRRPRRTGEDQRARDKRARRVTFEGSSRDNGGATVEAIRRRETRQNHVVAGMAAGDGESGVGGGEGTVKAALVERGRSRTVEAATVAARDGLWTVEGGTAAAGRWSRREGDQRDGDGGCGTVETGTVVARTISMSER